MAKKFPDLTGDGKVTQADVLKGRGVIKGKKTPAKKSFAAAKVPGKLGKKARPKK
jgi:hypothetical protein